MNILLIPSDLLRQLADCYRVWKLLCLTSRSIAERLGDYHIYNGYTLSREDNVLDYTDFMRGLMCYLSSAGYSGEYSEEMFIIDICLERRSYIEVFTDNHQIIFYNKYDADIYFEIKEGFFTIENHSIMMFGHKYGIILGKCPSIADALRRIYEDLPGMFSKISIYKRVKYEDTLSAARYHQMYPII
jgi:hypothetical protein